MGTFTNQDLSNVYSIMIGETEVFMFKSQFEDVIVGKMIISSILMSVYGF